MQRFGNLDPLAEQATANGFLDLRQHAPSLKRLCFGGLSKQQTNTILLRLTYCATKIIFLSIYPVREGRFLRAFLKRSGMRRLRVVPRKHASGRPGSPSGPTMRLCHVMAGRGWDEGGEIRRMASHWLASQPGSTVPAPKIAASGAPQGDTPSAFARGGRRTDYRCALRRTAPLIVEGRGKGHSSGRFRPRERRRLPVTHAV